MATDEQLAGVARQAIIDEEGRKAVTRAKARIAQGDSILAKNTRVQVIDGLMDALSEQYKTALNKDIRESSKERKEITAQINLLQTERDKLAPPQVAKHKLPRHIESVKVILK